VITLRKLTWIELKLFLREPVTVMLAFALPVIFLFVRAGVSGNDPETTVPGCLGLVAASVGVVSVPVHLASYREQGILRRLHASSVSKHVFFASQILAAVANATLSAVVLAIVGLVAYGVPLPKAPLQLVVGFGLGTTTMVSMGMMMGSLLSTTRSAQGLGLMFFFVMWPLSGLGPALDAMSPSVRALSDALPMRYVVGLAQDGWLGFGWDATSYGVTIGFCAVFLLISVNLFRWE
jgi:ABC-2 type transport system permease protein